jgi:hypothetical protein
MHGAKDHGVQRDLPRPGQRVLSFEQYDEDPQAESRVSRLRACHLSSLSQNDDCSPLVGSIRHSLWRPTNPSQEPCQSPYCATTRCTTEGPTLKPGATPPS